METIQPQFKAKKFFRYFSFAGTGIALLLAVIVFFLPPPHKEARSASPRLDELDYSVMDLKADGCIAILPNGRALKLIAPNADGKLFIPAGTKVSSQCFARKGV